MRKENRSLWRTRHLFTRLMGDHTWAPCGMMIGPNDVDLFTDAIFDRKDPETNGDQHLSTHTSTERPARILTSEGPREAEDADTEEVPMLDAEIDGTTQQVDKQENTGPNGTATERPKDANQALGSVPTANGKSAGVKESGVSTPLDTSTRDRAAGLGESPENGDVEMQLERPSKHHEVAMESSKNNDETTRPAQPQPEDCFIHPIFHPPANAHPDKGGLSEAEAEEMRRLVALYVQKQEEVCRGAHKLHEGLLRAERLRQTVLKWSKFEAHCGASRDLSDGEDWYDKEEWGLTEDLKKGQDEEEEDNTATATKKTRNRR